MFRKMQTSPSASLCGLRRNFDFGGFFGGEK
jgi:hypothetical protein